MTTYTDAGAGVLGPEGGGARATGIGAETVVALQWVEAVLKASPSLAGYLGDRIYEGAAPKSAAYPFVIYDVVSAVDLMVVGPERIWSDTLVLVKAVAQSSSLALAPLASAIDVALTSPTGGTVASPSGQVFTSVREEPFRLHELDSELGVWFTHLGGRYRLYAKGT